jgi:hypothetical protein
VQKFTESLRLTAQFLEALPPIGGSAVPIAAERVKGAMLYPAPNSVQLAADADTLIFSEQGCITERCTPHRVQAAQYLADLQAHRHLDALPNIALSSWIRNFLNSTKGVSSSSLKQDALQLLKTAAAGFLETSWPEEDWLKVVATVAPSQQLTGHSSAVACQNHTTAQAVPGCDCSISLPALYSIGLYGVTQVPIVLLDMVLKPGTPESVIQNIEETFHTMWSSLSAPLDVCVTPAARLATTNTSIGCTPTATGTGTGTESAPAPAPAPAHLPALDSTESSDKRTGWRVWLHHGGCKTIPAGSTSSQIVVPWFDASNSSDVVKTTREKIDFSRSSCSQGFRELPAAQEWKEGFCLAAVTHICLTDPSAVQLVRVVLSVAGSSSMAAAVYVDGQAVAWLQKQPAGGAGAAVTMTRSRTVDTLLFLDSEKCKTLLIVYDDGGQHADAPAVELVRAMPWSGLDCYVLWNVLGFCQLHPWKSTRMKADRDSRHAD